MSTPFPGVVERLVDANNKTIAEVDTSGNVTYAGGGTFGGTVAVTGSVTSTTTASDALTAAGAINVLTPYTTLVTTGEGYAVTLAAPSRAGLVKVIEMITDGGFDVTLAMTNMVGGSASTTVTFNDAGDQLVLVSAASKWIVLKERGVTVA